MQIRKFILNNEKMSIKLSASKDKAKTPTPAQNYASRCIDALEELINNPQNHDRQDEVYMLIMERPQTLKCALSAYLYKSQMARLQRRY